MDSSAVQSATGWLIERRGHAQPDALAGATPYLIGEALGVGRERISQIVQPPRVRTAKAKKARKVRTPPKAAAVKKPTRAKRVKKK